MDPWSLLVWTALNDSKVIKYINYYSDLLGCCWQSWYIFSPLLSWFCGEGRTSGSALATCSSFFWSGSDWSYQHHWDAGSGSQFKAGSQCRSCATWDLAADASISTSWLDHGEMAFGALLEQEVEVLRRRLGWSCSSEPWIWHMMSEEGSHVWSLRRPGCCFQALNWRSQEGSTLLPRCPCKMRPCLKSTKLQEYDAFSHESIEFKIDWLIGGFKWLPVANTHSQTDTHIYIYVYNIFPLYDNPVTFMLLGCLNHLLRYTPHFHQQTCSWLTFRVSIAYGGHPSNWVWAKSWGSVGNHSKSLIGGNGELRDGCVHKQERDPVGATIKFSQPQASVWNHPVSGYNFDPCTVDWCSRLA